MITELQANKAAYVIQNVVSHEDIITSNGLDGGSVADALR